MLRIIPLAVLCAVLVAGACAPYEEFDYQPNDEMKPGAGLFTGERGAWVLVGDDKSKTGDDGGTSSEEETRRDEPKSNRPLKIRGRRKKR